MRLVEKARLWANNVGVAGGLRGTGGRARVANAPRVFTPPYGGAAYYGQAYRWEQVLHYKFWSFVAISAWVHEIAGGAPPNVGEIRPKVKKPTPQEVRRYSKRLVNKALGGPRPHEEFEAWDDDHPCTRVFRCPNSLDVAYDLWAWHVLFKKLTGQAHWWVIRNKFRAPVEIWVIPTHWMRLETDYNGLPVSYAVQSPWGTLQHVPYEDVVSFYEHSPLNRYEGWAVSLAISEWIDCYEAQIRTRLAVYKNGAVPAFHVQLGDSYMDPDEAFLARFYARWFSRFLGEDNAGRPLITGADVTIKEIGAQTPAQLVEATVTSEDQMRDMTLAAYKVPKGVVGLEPTADVSAYAPQRQFCRFAINPELHYTGQIASEFIIRRTPSCERGGLWWDDRVIDDPEQKLRELEFRAANAATSPNEIRTEFGDEPWPHGGDDPLLGGAPVPWATGQKSTGELERTFNRVLGQSSGANGGYLTRDIKDKLLRRVTNDELKELCERRKVSLNGHLAS